MSPIVRTHSNESIILCFCLNSIMAIVLVFIGLIPSRDITTLSSLILSLKKEHLFVFDKK